MTNSINAFLQYKKEILRFGINPIFLPKKKPEEIQKNGTAHLHRSATNTELRTWEKDSKGAVCIDRTQMAPRNFITSNSVPLNL